MTDTMTHSQAAEKFLRSLDVKTEPTIGISKVGTFTAYCYWPDGDVLRGKGCFGQGASIDAAVTDMLAEAEKAKAAGKTIRTAAECKDAVLSLIREHDAAPASFRDAVDNLRVA